MLVTDITIFEVGKGFFNLNSKSKLNSFFEFVSTLDIVLASNSFSLEAARLNRQLKNKGVVIDDNDLLIAGLLKANGISNLVTRNKKHFRNVDFIKTIDY